MKLYVTKDNISHRGVTVRKGDVIEELDSNHIGGLQSVGCQKYDELKHGPIKESKPEPAIKPEPEPEEAPEPPKKKVAKKRGRKPRA